MKKIALLLIVGCSEPEPKAYGLIHGHDVYKWCDFDAGVCCYHASGSSLSCVKVK